MANIHMEVENYSQQSQDYERIEQAIRFLETHSDEQPSLKEIAQSINLSEYHFQRLFSRWVGISPKRFMQYLTKERAKQMLRKENDLLSVAYASGLSGPSRLHDLFVTYEGVTPGEYKQRGHGLAIHYGFHQSPFGECLVAHTERAICNLMFVQEDGREESLKTLRGYWPAAEIYEDMEATGYIVDGMVDLFQKQASSPLRLYLSGTNFQLKVWEALLQIPSGSVVSYEDIAIYIGIPTATRAVGNAVSRNPIPVLIPCHRVIRKTGEFGAYRWGTTRKKAILGWEMAQLNHSPANTMISTGA